jgi:hypothetical protein
MDDTVNEEKPVDDAPAPKAPNFGLGTWTADDRKILVITVVGSVAANLATVLLVGLAVALLRLVRPAAGQGPVWLFYAAAVGTLLLTGFAISRPEVRQLTRPGGSKVSRASIALNAAVFLEALLILVGLAAGVK